MTRTSPNDTSPNDSKRKKGPEAAAAAFASAARGAVRGGRYSLQPADLRDLGRRAGMPASQSSFASALPQRCPAGERAPRHHPAPRFRPRIRGAGAPLGSGPLTTERRPLRRLCFHRVHRIRSVEAAVKAGGLDSSAPTLVLAECVLVYMPSEAAAALLARAHSSPPPLSLLASQPACVVVRPHSPVPGN